MSLLPAIARGRFAPEKDDQRRITMDLFSELESNIESFKVAREDALTQSTLPPSDMGVNFGKPPFAIDDGINYYAVIDKKGDVLPLPFGYQIPDQDFDTAGLDEFFSKPVSSVRSGFNTARYIPLAEDFEMPGERAFCLETAEDSEAWKALGQAVESMQDVISERAIFNFNQRLSNAVVALYDSYELFESVEQAVSLLFSDSSVSAAYLIRSYRHALDRLEEELNEGEDE